MHDACNTSARANDQKQGRNSASRENKFQSAVRAKKNIENVFFEPVWRRKLFQMKVWVAAINSIKFSSKSELTSRFFSRLKFSIFFRNFERPFTPRNQLRSASNLAKTRFRRSPTFHFSTAFFFSAKFSDRNFSFSLFWLGFLCVHNTHVCCVYTQHTCVLCVYTTHMCAVYLHDTHVCCV